MSETKESIRRPKWRRRIAIGITGVVALMILAFLALTSSAFLKGVVLPGVGEMLDAKISASGLVLSPFSSLVARDVRIVPNGAEPLLELAELRVRYSLGSLISGKPKVHEITLVGPKVQIIGKADGTSNFTPIQKALEKLSKAGKPKPPKPESPPIISVKAVTLENGTFRFSSKTRTGGSEVVVEKIRVTLDQLENSQAGKLAISSVLGFEQTLTVDGKPKQSTASAKLDATVGIRLDAQLNPAVISASIRAAVESGTGDFVAFKDAKLEVEGDLGESELKKFSLSVLSGSEVLAALKASGPLNLASKEAHISVEVQAVDKKLLNLLGTAANLDFLDTTFAAKFSIDSSKGGQAIETKGRFQVGKLGVRRLAQTTPQTDLDMAFDATAKGGVFDMKQIKLTLQPTQRAGNVVVLTGRLNLQSTNAASGQISIRGDSLDLTPVMDFLAEPNGGAPSKQVEVSSKAKVSGEEPAGVQLPVSNLTADVQLGKVFVQDLVISNVVTTLRIQTNVLQLNPFQLTCNGAVVTASSVVDLSKPGFVYDFKLSADKIPVEPLANSFAPAYKGQAQGDLSAFADIKGAGITDLGLLKNLSGKAGISFTNANIQLVGPKVRIILTPIAMLLRVPELLQSPMNGFQAQLEVGKGNLEVKRVELRTEAFQASTSGTIPLQSVLTNSPLNLPIAIALRRSIAQKSNLISANTPTNAAFVTLPVFATVKGTLGAPETKTDALVLAGLGLKSVVGLSFGAGEKAGNIIQGLGKLLTGEKPAPAAAVPNPQPDPNAPAKVNPLDVLRLIPEKKEKKP